MPLNFVSNSSIFYKKFFSTDLQELLPKNLWELGINTRHNFFGLAQILFRCFIKKTTFVLLLVINFVLPARPNVRSSAYIETEIGLKIATGMQESKAIHYIRSWAKAVCEYYYSTMQRNPTIINKYPRNHMYYVEWSGKSNKWNVSFIFRLIIILFRRKHEKLNN